MGRPQRHHVGVYDPDETQWMERAACAHSTVDFYPDSQLETALRLPKSVCESCPVRVPCLRYALDHAEKHGVWGGTSETERRRIRRRLAKTEARRG